MFKKSARLGTLNHWIAGSLLLAVVGAGLFFAGVTKSHAPSKAPEHGTVPAGTRTATPEEQARIAASFGNLPLSFEPNQGQTDREVKFLSRNSGYNLFLTSSEAVFTLPVRSSEKVSTPRAFARAGRTRPDSQAVLRMEILGANPRPQVQGDTPIEGHTNYLIGRDANKWTRNVPQYARVNYRGVYPGVDLTFYGQQRQLEFDFIVKPGANPATIALGIQGAKKIGTDAAGDLVLTSAAGDIRLRKPVAYQNQGEKRQPVDARFVVKGKEVALAVGDYDRGRELVIDPSLVYSTFLGGGSQDEGFAIAVEQNCASAGQCAAFITGETASTGFPLKNAYQGTLSSGSTNAFVTKLNAAGTGLVYSTFLGGSGNGTNKADSGNAIAVDATGNAYVAGATQSDTDFPLVGSSFQTAFGGGTQDAFVAKFDVNGQLVYSSYLGGDDVDTALGIAVDTVGNFYVTGSTKSALFPTQGAWQSALGAGTGDTDAFVSKFNANGTIAYSSYLGGSLIDIGTGIAVDAAGNAYVSGLTFSADLTTTAGAFQTACGGCGSTVDHSFVAAVKAIPIVASPFLYLTYLSGNNTDEAQSIAVDTTGSAYVVGLTKSTNFPSTPGGFKITAPSGNTFAFVTKLNPTGTALSYSTYLGGNNDTEGLAVAVGAGATPKVYVTGRTASTDFPTTANVPQTTSGGVGDAFVSELDPAASGAASLVISTYLGGSKDDDSSLLAGIAVDGQGNIYVTGDTLSGTNDFPTIPGSWDTAYGGSHDAFVAKYSPQTLAAQFTVDAGTMSPSAISRGSNGTSTVTVTSTGFVGNVNLGCNITPVTAKPPTCSVTTPVALASATDSKTATLTITTVKTGAASLTGAALWLPIPGMALVGAGLLSHKTRKKKLLNAIMGCLAFAGLLLMLACGSGNGTGGGGGGGGGGTTTGSYTVTVTGAANGTNTSGTANFTVQ